MKRQRTISQIREKEEHLSAQEILSLQEKDFRPMTVKMVQDIGNRLEAKTDNLEQTLSKEVQDLKCKQVEMQNTITEIKNSEATGEYRRQKNE